MDEELYKISDTKEGEHELYGIEKLKDKKSNYLNGVSCIKSVDAKNLI